MFSSITKLCKYIYEKLSDRYNNLIIDQRRLLEENSFYCRMMDPDFCHKPENRIVSEKPQIIKDRMETYRK
jgi:hypothetical protein